MAKTLFLVRHGKAELMTGSIPDIERPLNDRGRNKALEVAKRLETIGVEPDLVLASPATRAHETAEVFCKVLHYPIDKITTEDLIYHGDAEKLYGVICALPDDKNNVMFFGHNPIITYLANMLCRESVMDFPTSAVCCLEFDMDSWEEIKPNSARLVYFEY